MSGARIIEGLKDAIVGNLGRVTIEGETWAKVKDIHADQQEIMRINNSLRDALIQIRAVCEDNQSASCDHEKALLFVRGIIAKTIK